uniref:RNA-directed DNA polymerase n=1 Tax=Caenorhabditis japonica TaxID=281687 RepID=A0A8R1I9D7_CAEJA
MDHPPQLSCETTRSANPTLFRDAVIKDLHLTHDRITNVYEDVCSRINELRITTESGAASTAVARIVHAQFERGQEVAPADSPQTQTLAVTTDHSLIKSYIPSPRGDTLLKNPITAKPGKPIQAGGEMDITPTQLAAESDDTNVEATDTRKQQGRRNSRSSSATRRVTRSMTASATPRVNVVSMKTNSSVPMFSGTTKENYHTFMRHFTDHVNIMPNPSNREIRNLLLTVLTDFARDKAEEVLDSNPDATYEDVCTALRSQYENQYTTQARLDAIKNCFQYDQEPVQDYYQRIRTSMREAQTGTNRQDVTKAAFEAFIEGLQPEIRFQVEMRQSNDLEEAFKDAIFAEKALNRKSKAVRTSQALAAAKCQQTAEVYAQAVQQHQAQFGYSRNNCTGGYSHNGTPNTEFPAIAAFTPHRDARQGYPQGENAYRQPDNTFDQSRTPNRSFTHYPNRSFGNQRHAGNQRLNTSQNLNYHQSPDANSTCWYCGIPGHFRQECRTRARDRAQGISRNSRLEAPFAPRRPNFPRNHRSQTPLDPVENHRQPAVRVIETRHGAGSEEANIREQYNQQLKINQVQANRIKDISWRLHAYQMGQDPSGLTQPNVNIIAPHEEESRVVTSCPVASSYVTAQIPIKANGHPCHALVDTGASITVTSESSHDLFCTLPMLPPTASSALGLGGNAVHMVGSAFIRFEIGECTIDHLTHYTKGRCTPAGPKDYTFIIGNDVLSQIPTFRFDYAKGRFHVGNSVLPLGSQKDIDTRPGNYKIQLSKEVTFPAESESIVDCTLNRKIKEQDMITHNASSHFEDAGLIVNPTVFNSAKITVLVTNPTHRDVTLPARTSVGCAGRIYTDKEGNRLCLDTAFDELSPGVAAANALLPELHDDFKLNFDDIKCTNSEKYKLQQLCEKYPDVFSRNPYDLGSSRTDPVHIYTSTEVPIKGRAYRVPVKYQSELEQHINALLKSERITESNTPWTSPIVLVKKKNGSLRVCLDFRKLNEVTIPDNFPLPRIDAILEKVGGARYFSSLDMANGYLQLRLDAQSSYKCGFVTESRVYAYTHLPFGLKSAASYFQRALKTVLAGMDDDVMLYIDDILVYSQEFDQHIETLERVLKRFRQFNLKVSPKKCEFLKSSISFLGHTISRDNYGPNHANVKTILETSTPKNLPETRRFVGMIGFFRKFIPQFSSIAEPLTRLNKKDEKFTWGPEQEKAFNDLRQAIIEKPVLRFPDYEKPFHIFTDASSIGLGAALMQTEDADEKQYRPIAYASRTLASTETRWPAIQVEMLAIIFALRHFRPYICLSRIILHTDHRPLRYLLSKNKVNDNLARWLIELQQYDITIEYIEGKRNTVADFLSRSSDAIQAEDQEMQDVVAFPLCLVSTHEPPPRIFTAITSKPPININEEQAKDPELHTLRAIVERRPTPALDLQQEWIPHLEAVEVAPQGHLVVQFTNPRTPNPKIIVPSTLRKLVIQGNHTSMLGGGHFNWRTTMHKIQKIYFWPHMRKDVAEFCKRCHKCQLRRPKSQDDRENQLTVPSNRVFQRVGVDLTGPLKETRQGNRYYLNAVCWFTKYIIAVPLPDARTETCAQALLNNVVLRFGTMSELITDGASNFTSAAFKNFCSLLEIDQHIAIPHHSKGNGATERTFRTFHNAIAKYVNANHTDWEIYLQATCFAYNTSQHSTTGESPFYLMHGRDPVFPIEKILNPSPGNDEDGDPQEWKQFLTSNIQKAWEEAAEHSEDMQQYRQKLANAGAVPPKIQVGDKVVMKNFKSKVGLSRKLVMPWEGMYRVISIDRPFADIVDCRNPAKPAKRIHLDQVKQFWEDSGESDREKTTTPQPDYAPSRTKMRSRTRESHRS